jgi:hypothetical protein
MTVKVRLRLPRPGALTISEAGRNRARKSLEIRPFSARQWRDKPLKVV